MLVLLPPSETKVSGGISAPLRLDGLSFESLLLEREQALAALSHLLTQGDPAAASALKLGARQLSELEVNRDISKSRTLPAIQRYTGVLFDALDFQSLSAAARSWIQRTVVIHNALFGLLGAGDLIPNYRFGANVKLTELGPLNRHWSGAISHALELSEVKLVIDLRSSAYVKLGPVPIGKLTVVVRPVQQLEDGSLKLLNHFNKAAKGRLVRQLAQRQAAAENPADFLELLNELGYRFVRRDHGEIDLIETQHSTNGSSS